MHRIGKGLLGAVCLVFLGGAAPSTLQLYIRNRETPLQKQPTLSSPVLTRIPAGATVTWLGAGTPKKDFDKVRFGTQEGFVPHASLSTRPPSAEVSKTDGKPITAQAFASSGAATRGLSEAGLKYDKTKNPHDPKLALSVISVEGIARQVREEKGGAK
ncbi:MAG: SH3 domain-containing protein [Myxococcaceae bacterium]|nr:SH3 domain-containing protein [Myxococcaceae bacterium]